jgi:hypothetical protein
MTKASNYTSLGTGQSIRKALNLGPEASDNDVIAAIEAKKRAVEKAKQDVAYAKSTAAYRRSPEYLADVAKREEQKTVTNAARSYMKSSAAEIESARRDALANHPAVKAELQKINRSSTGVQSNEPRSVGFVGGDQAEFDSTVQSAYSQMRAIAEEVRRASGKLTIEQAMSQVMADPKYRELVAREIEERSYSGAHYLPTPDME